MISLLNSMPFSICFVLNIFIICGSVYYIIKEKKQKKLYIPIMYLIPFGSVICLFYKYISEKSDLIQYSIIAKYFLFGYVGVFLITVLIIGIIGLTTKKSVNVNKPIVLAGILLILFGALGLLIISQS